MDSNKFQLENQSMVEFSNRDLQNQPSSYEPIEDNNCRDDCEFSDGVLRYIDQILIEEEMDEQTHMLQESLDFQVKERSFYEVLGQKYPPSPLQESAPKVQYNERPNNNYLTASINDGSRPPIDGVDTHTDYDVYLKKGFDDVIKFIPSESKILDEARGEKNCHIEENDCEEYERSKKLPAVYTESNNVPIEEFDDIMLYTVGEHEKKLEAYRTDLQDAIGNSSRPIRGRVKKKNMKEAIDLTSLLIDSAKFVAAGDHRAANEFLKKIRQHSSPYGDGGQRLAYYFTDGLEARLAGTGSHIHRALISKRKTASDYLRAYYTCIASCPFANLSDFITNKFITIKSEKAMRVYVIDFGILYGFQWPNIIQCLSEREGGPPKLRITGIDFPQPGFRPTERVEDTGRRLACYAKTFNVPFEYNAIAQKWETIKVEDLKIENGEFVAVNCLYRAQNLSDEPGSEECSRAKVLKLIRKINPDIFINGIVNVSYDLSFFLSRFREAVYHYSALYDMLEATIPREKPERMLVERDMIGSEALNVIACEGWERVERCETYKQWRVRNLKAGFVQVPFERQLIDSATYKLRKHYHREFMVDEVNKWLMMGWKGRILYVITNIDSVPIETIYLQLYRKI